MVRKVQPSPGAKTRRELEAEYGMAWDTRQLARVFIVLKVVAPNALVVRRKADGVVGTMKYQDEVRYYFDFRPQADLAV